MQTVAHSIIRRGGLFPLVLSRGRGGFIFILSFHRYTFIAAESSLYAPKSLIDFLVSAPFCRPEQVLSASQPPTITAASLCNTSVWSARGLTGSGQCAFGPGGYC